MASTQGPPNATESSPQQVASAHGETHRQQPPAAATNTWAMRHMKCVICLDFMETAAMMKCGHVVCRECVLRIMSSNSRSCPICRAPLGHSSPRILDVDARNWDRVHAFFKFRNREATARDNFDEYRNGLDSVSRSDLVQAGLRKRASAILERLTYDQFILEYSDLAAIGGGIIVMDTGELACEATKEDMRVNELLFGSTTQTGGRKTDTLVPVKEISAGITSYIDGVNEHKPPHTAATLLDQQSSKLLRINRSILARNGSRDTLVILDVHGRSGAILGMKVVGDV
ncbi:hypothetical protein BGZ72_009487 [Mortierella alpina]|nr:hypothetical protein BGZ72_009487 [Mortierella alpina]